MPSVIAVFDIGKTNKKLFLFDEQYNILFEKAETFAETTDGDGDPCEDLTVLTDWVKSSLQEVTSRKDVEIKAINFSTYGASFVHIDREGVPVAPLYNYLKPYPEDLQKQFYEKYGGSLRFAMHTASPVLGNLNSGLQLYLLKNVKPELFSKIHYSLHLPQYLSFLVTGRRYSDITSIGCHTGMWDFTQNRYHEWLHLEGISKKLAPIFPSDQPIQAVLHGKPFVCGVGLHDSSAALIPYLATFKEPFVLISTGTWCITLNPFNQSNLSAEELQQDCLRYMEYRGKPIKASRLFAGYEHEQQVKRLASHFTVANDYYKSVGYDAAVVSELGKNQSSKGSSGNGMMEQSAFGARDLSSFKTYSEAYHQLIADLIQQQVTSTNLVMKNSKINRIFLDGGFSRNEIYMQLLAHAYPDIKINAASVAQASALGAALAFHPYWNKKPLPENLVQLKYYPVNKAFSS